MKKIIKRDGRVVLFDSSKIYQAILDAFIACDYKDSKLVEKITDEVVNKIDLTFGKGIPYVEDVQDYIEEALIKHNKAEIAKAFILYRNNRTQARNASLKLMDAVTKCDETSDTFSDFVNSSGLNVIEDFLKNKLIDPKLLSYIHSGIVYIDNLSSYSYLISDFTLDIKELFIDETDRFDFLLHLLKTFELILNNISGVLNIVNLEYVLFSKGYSKEEILNLFKYLNALMGASHKVSIIINRNSPLFLFFIEFDFKSNIQICVKNDNSKGNDKVFDEIIKNKGITFSKQQFDFSNVVAKYYINIPLLLINLNNIEEISKRIEDVFSLIKKSFNDKKELLKVSKYVKVLLPYTHESDINKFVDDCKCQVIPVGMFEAANYNQIDILSLTKIIYKESAKNEDMVLSYFRNDIASQQFASMAAKNGLTNGKAFYSFGPILPAYTKTNLSELINLLSSLSKYYNSQSCFVPLFLQSSISFEEFIAIKLRLYKIENLNFAFIFERNSNASKIFNFDRYPINKWTYDQTMLNSQKPIDILAETIDSKY